MAGQSGKPETMVSYATRRIKDALADGSISPGARLSPTAIAKEYELSHIPVREALSSLSATGYVVHKQGRGYFARELSTEDLEDIYRLRALLETEALTHAVPKMTDEDFTELSSLIDQMEACLSPDQRGEYLELNRQFHFLQFNRAGSRRLVRFLNYLWDSASPYSTLGGDPSAKGNEEHRGILQALIARDTDLLIQIMERHRHLRVENVEEWAQSKKTGL